MSVPDEKQLYGGPQQATLNQPPLQQQQPPAPQPQAPQPPAYGFVSRTLENLIHFHLNLLLINSYLNGIIKEQMKVKLKSRQI